MIAHIVSGILTLIACYMLMCRIDKMRKGTTKPIVFFQHALLAMGMFVSVVLNFTQFEDWSNGAMALGVMSFFFLSIKRWSKGAPDGTTRPGLLDPIEFTHVSGGRKD